MNKNEIKARNQAANRFFDLADTPGIDKAVRDRLREIGTEILNYRLAVLTPSSQEELQWLGETIKEYIDLGNLRIMDNYAAAVRKVLVQQQDELKGGRRMGFLIFGKKDKEGKKSEEQKKMEKNIFLSEQLIEKYISLINQEKTKIKDIITKASEEERDSPQYLLLQEKWALSKEQIQHYNTSMKLGLNTLKINTRMVSAMDILKTTQLLKQMLPDSSKAEKLLDKAVDKTADLADMQDELNSLFEDALDEIDDTASSPITSAEFNNSVASLSQKQSQIISNSQTNIEKSSDSAKQSASSEVTPEQMKEFLEGEQ